MTEHRLSTVLPARIACRLAHHLRSNILTIVVGCLGLLLVIGIIQFGAAAAASVTVPADRADQFMSALRDHNGEALSAAMSTAFRARVTPVSAAKGETDLSIFRQLAQRSSIIRYRRVAASALGQGGRIEVFLATSSDESGAEIDVPFMLTLNAEGFVDKVE